MGVCLQTKFGCNSIYVTITNLNIYRFTHHISHERQIWRKINLCSTILDLFFPFNTLKWGRNRGAGNTQEGTGVGLSVACTCPAVESLGRNRPELSGQRASEGHLFPYCPSG